MSDQIEWSDPPQSRGGSRARHTAFFDALRGRPGEWAVFPTRVRSRMVATHIKHGQYVGTEAGEFDATGRSNDDGTFKVYVRYVGAEKK